MSAVLVPVPLHVRRPFHGEALLVFLARHAVAGLETWVEQGGDDARRIDYQRSLQLPSGPAVVSLAWSAGQLSAALELTDQRDLDAGQQRIEWLCDLAVDPVEVAAALARDDQLRPLVAASPGLRVPGAVDLHEHLFRTLIGQQISLAGAASCAAKLVTRFGEPYPHPAPGRPTHLFPTAAALAGADPETLPMPRARGRALVQLAEKLATGALVLTREVEPAELRARLLRCRGVGPWTADYVLMRGLGHPDVLLSTDLVIRRALAAWGITDTGGWAPWRSYATLHLWRAWTG